MEEIISKIDAERARLLASEKPMTKEHFDQLIAHVGRTILGSLSADYRADALTKLRAEHVILGEKVHMDDLRYWRNIALARLQAVKVYLSRLT